MTNKTIYHTAGFIIYDKVTGQELASLPTTIPIGVTVEGFERAGYQVGWRWNDETSELL